MKINCPCGYKYYFDHVTGRWVIKGSEQNKRPELVSEDLGLYACPECGAVYHDKF